jgi:beta-lactamase superfamily II metal-dependent hydrolase
MFRIHMLPAEQGDAIVVEYGTARRLRRILIDAGTPATAHVVREWIEGLPRAQRRLELMVVTHIDTDHIGGVLKLLDDPPEGFDAREVWFNGWQHLSDIMGPFDGEILSVQLKQWGAPWNQAWKGGAAVIPDDGELPSVLLAGGMRLTLLSPGLEQLRKLRKEWKKVLRDAGLEPGTSSGKLRKKARRKGVDILGGRLEVKSLAASPFEPDDAVANGSSIALLAEYEGRTVLLAGDAFAHVLEGAVGRLLAARKKRRLDLDAFKLPHHGSKGNITDSLLSRIRCSRYLFSTNGASFSHPDPEAVARVIAHGGRSPTLMFNYRCETTSDWDDMRLRKKHRYKTVYPVEGLGGLTIDLDA